jgi:hypothetical protein
MKNKTDFFQQKPEPNAGDSKQKTLKDDGRSTAYSSNVFDILEGNAFIKVDPSKMMKLASGSVSGGVTCFQNCCKLRFLTAVEITIITQSL